MEAFAEPKLLSPSDLATLARRLGSFTAVAQLIGASEAFVRQTAQNKKYVRKIKRPSRRET